MMNHDPFQTYQTPGAYQTPGVYSAGVSPFGLPYGAPQPFINPAAFAGYGINPHLQGGFGGGQNPLLQNPLLQNQQLQNPLLQNQLLQNPILQNPLVQQALLQNQLQQLAWQNQLLSQAQGNQGWPQQQQQFGGYPQQGPQSMIGVGGIGQPFGQIHPLAQLALRQATGFGISPYGGSF